MSSIDLPSCGKHVCALPAALGGTPILSHADVDDILKENASLLQQLELLNIAAQLPSCPETRTTHEAAIRATSQALHYNLHLLARLADQCGQAVEAPDVCEIFPELAQEDASSPLSTS